MSVIRKVTQKQYDRFVLAYQLRLEGKKYREIAEHFGTSIKNAHNLARIGYKIKKFNKQYKIIDAVDE